MILRIAQSQFDSLPLITPRQKGQNTNVSFCVLLHVLKAFDRMEAKTKSGSSFPKSCGPSRPNPSPFCGVHHSEELLFLRCTPFFFHYFLIIIFRVTATRLSDNCAREEMTQSPVIVTTHSQTRLMTKSPNSYKDIIVRAETIGLEKRRNSDQVCFRVFIDERLCFYHLDTHTCCP